MSLVYIVDTLSIFTDIIIVGIILFTSGPLFILFVPKVYYIYNKRAVINQVKL
jgi:hypothetical protein